MTDFFRFPHTPHITWLGKGMPRGDKVLASHEVEVLLSGKVRVEEKLDGANLGISLGTDGALRAQNRGQYLLEPFIGQFSRLGSWLAQHQWALTEKLNSDLILFGEWCAAKHSLDYESLPDWFLVFDVYDRRAGRFWSSARRNSLAAKLELSVVPSVYEGSASLPALKKILATSTSRYRDGPPEGLVIRRDSGDWCEARAKLVRAEFTQKINEHWRSRTIEWNRVALDESKSI
ncbi:RNA ligase family protein [Saccharospirillum sp.]|uniref:RNA ligase family protein n=1 Tax=Saccharospirillum sp. TaxID=2033801 RepID=UPI0034A0924C